MNVLIAGTGILGRTLIDLYLNRGDTVRALSFSDDDFQGLEHPNLQPVTGDVTHPETLLDLCDGMDVVISCIGITRMKGPLTHQEVDFQGNLNLLREAEKAGVEKFGFISPAGVDEGHESAPLLAAKYQFETELKQSAIEWLVFRSGGFFNDLAGMLDLAKKGPLFVIGSGKAQSTPIDVRDLAVLMIEEMDQTQNKMISVGGPEDLSWNDLCNLCVQHCGRKSTIIHIPQSLCTLTLALLHPFSKSTHAMGRLILFMSTHDLLTEKRGTRTFAEALTEPDPPTFSPQRTPKNAE